MDKLFAIIGREFGERVRSRWFVLTTLFGPVLFAGLLIGPPLLAVRSQRSVDPGSLVVLDATTQRLGEGVASDLAGGIQSAARPPRVIVIAPASLDSATGALREQLLGGSISGVLTLRPETPASGSAELVLRSGVAISIGDRVERALERQLRRSRLAALGLSASDADDIAALRINLQTVRLAADGRQASARVNILFGFGVAILLYAAIVLYGQIVLRSVSEEKQTRVAEVVLASVPARLLLAGKIVGIGGVALVQLGIWTGAVVALLANRATLFAKLGVEAASLPLPSIAPASLILLLAFFVLGFVLYAALFALVGSIASSEHEAQQAQTPVLMLLVSSVALMQAAVTDPNGSIARAMSIIPFSSPIMMPLRLGLTDVTSAELMISIGLLSLSGVVALLVAGRVYRTALLMYGKKPSLREIVRWLRASE